jgi:uncharacterized protein (TIGR00375 family)
MQIIADLHIHSSYSRATSKDITIDKLSKYARIKGLDLLGTGDFTHSIWLQTLKKSLTEDGSGILKSKDGFGFVLSSEISSIYKQSGSVRRVHNVVLTHSFETAEQINNLLKKRGVNLESDGRPICGLSCPELADIVKSVDTKNEIIPAHIWTPWFSLFGSESGFDRITDCFQDRTKDIFALETGLSSDPAMNWRLSQLDRFSIVSFSDSHSFWPWRIGREATILDLKDLGYENLIKALRTKEGFSGTIEVDPSYGKYHFDGHRNCNVSLDPKDAIKMKNICPVCHRPLTIGVLHRVEELADRPEGFEPKDAQRFYSVLPLSEIIGSCLGVENLYSKAVWEIYNKLIEKFGSEFNVLLKVGLKDLETVADKKIADMIIAIREHKIKINPGYDGVYGRIAGAESPAGTQTQKNKIKSESNQKSLIDF